MSIEKINRKNGVVFRARVFTRDGHTLSKVFSRKSDALLWQSEFNRKVRLGDLAQSDKNRMTFRELSENWFDSYARNHCSLKTQSDYRGILNKHLLNQLGNIRLDGISRMDGETLVAILNTKKLHPKTINKTVNVARQILKYGEAHRYLSRSPFLGIRQLKCPTSGFSYLSSIEIKSLLMESRGHSTYGMMIVALNTGMRLGEIAGLCWDRVDLQRRLITISRKLDRDGLKDQTKTNLIRHIPMNDVLLDFLKEQWRLQKNPRFVITDNHGQPIKVDHFCEREFRKALARANLAKIRFHDLRHTYASHFVMNGGSVFDLQKILGHTRVDMTMRYAHLSQDHLHKAVQMVSFGSELNKDVPQIDHETEKVLKFNVISMT